MSSSYTASSVFHALPERERKVKFDFEVPNESESTNYSSDEDLKLAIRLQKEENALAMEMEQRRIARVLNSGRRRSGRSCAHGFGLKTVPPVPKIDGSQEKRQRSLSPTQARSMGQESNENIDDVDDGQIIKEVRSDSPTMSMLRYSSTTNDSSSEPTSTIPVPVQAENSTGSTAPAWLKVKEVENSAKECWQETEKILKEDTEKVKDFRRRTGMGMFAPKWR